VRDYIPLPTNPHHISTLAAQEQIKIRSVVLRSGDGNYHPALKVESNMDKALPSAEILALGSSTKGSARGGITEAHVMEFNPSNIAKGVMGSSPPDALERLGKRGGEQLYHFYPFNNGQLREHELKLCVEKRQRAELLPGNFLGIPATSMGK
jgi:hypothetical protein